jgi:hypothetical protein
MKPSCCSPPLCSAPPPHLAAEEGSLREDIPFPRTTEGDGRITYAKCTIRTLEARNYPDEEDIEKARANDPKDSSWLWWQFEVANRGPEKFKIKLVVEVLDKTGQVSSRATGA